MSNVLESRPVDTITNASRDALAAARTALAAARTALSQRLFEPVDIASLVFFRIAFGSIMLWETWRYYDHGWIGRYFTGKEFYFTYWPFDFVQPWPGDGMFIHFGLMAVFAACIVLGLFYRVSATAFFLMFTYVFLLEQARYLNHYYLVCLIAFVMIFMPANRHFSLDALLNPGLRSRVVPAWSVWLLRFQVAVPMFFGGIAKLNADWLRGEPLRAWLANRTDFPFLGQFFTDEPVVWLLVYGGLLIDLLFVFYMLNRRTRVFGFMLLLSFHLMNSRLFNIGIFPWLMIASTLIFFGPDWPRRVLHDLRQGHVFRSPAFVGGFCFGFLLGSLVPDDFSLVPALVTAIGIGVTAYHLDEPFLRAPVQAAAAVAEPARTRLASRLAQRWILALLGVWVAFQILLPLRHFVIPGKVHWTEEGHNFAWHMKLRDKDSSGFFIVTDPASGKTWEVDPRDYLNSRQERKMTSHPQKIVQFVHYLEDRMRDEGYEDVEVRARIFASLNGRERQQLVDPQVDLTKVSYPWFGHADWIIHLEVPLRQASLDPENAKRFYNRGTDYRRSGEYQHAIEDYDEAIRLDRQYVSAYNDRGIAYKNLGQYERAIQDYDQAILLAPHYKQAYNNRGNAFRGLEQYQRAIEDYDEAIRLDPGYALAHANRARAYIVLGRDIPRVSEVLSKAFSALTQHPWYDRLIISNSALSKLQLRVASSQDPTGREDPTGVLNGQAESALVVVPHFAFSQTDDAPTEVYLVMLDDPTRALDTEHINILLERLRELGRNVQLIVASQETERFQEMIPKVFDEDSYVIIEPTGWSPHNGPTLTIMYE